jgi:hypothetical protein
MKVILLVALAVCLVVATIAEGNAVARKSTANRLFLTTTSADRIINAGKNLISFGFQLTNCLQVSRSSFFLI